MEAFAGLVVTPELGASVRALAERIGPVGVRASGPFAPLVSSFRLGTVATLDPRTENAQLVMGLPAAVLKHAASTSQPFGFVTPVARRKKPWQPGPTWRDETTMDLWRAGWSPKALDRLLVPVDGGELEVVVGDLRRTPQGPAA